MHSTPRSVLISGLALLGAALMPAPSGASADTVVLSSSRTASMSHAGLPANVPGLRTAHAISGGFHGRAWWRHPRPGHTVRQGQRMARKRRNVQRARRAARG